MSRCFPYPPPGYVPSIARKEALIESIKLQEERLKSEEQRKKEKRREKKEKKEKKEKRKHKKEKTNQNLDKSDVVQGHIGEKIPADTKGDLRYSQSKVENEQLERSTLTEEHGQPDSLHVPSTSSDSTDNSNKRKRVSSLADAPTCGKILRIRLPCKKQNQSIAPANEEQHCTTSGRTELPLQDDIVMRLQTQSLSCRSEGTPSIVQSPPLRTDDGKISSSSQPSASQATLEIPMVTDRMSSKQRKSLSKYTNLIENWVPPQLEAILDAEDDDDNWLFKSKNPGVPLEKRRTTLGNDGLSCSSSSTSWPRAQYLQEVDLFALPYTVPF